MVFYLRAGVKDLQIQLSAVDGQPFMVQGIWGEDEKWQQKKEKSSAHH